MKLITAVCFTCCFLCFFGCSSGPRAIPIEPPSLAIEKALLETQNNTVTVYPAELPEDWWSLFEDEQLTYFIQQAFYANPDLQSARANILMAAYNADKLKASLFPNFNLGGDILREKLSETALIPFNTMPPNGPAPPLTTPLTAGANGIPVYFTQFETEVLLSYDIDLWGKNRNTWVAALGQMWASAADEIFRRLQLGIAVAQTYFRLQIYYKRLEVAQELLETELEYVRTVEKRINNNIDNHISLQTAEDSLAAARQTWDQLISEIAVDESRLRAYLAGNFLEEVERVEIAQKSLPKVPLPGDLPLHLISHRPDITAQLWMIESAGKQINVAKAGFYPDFTLNGLFGYQTIHLHKLFQWPSTFYNIDPAFTLPLFDGGRLLANLRGSEVNYDLAILQYNQLIINAVQEVLSSLAVLQQNQNIWKDFEQRKFNQNEIYRLTKLKVEHNLSSVLDLLTSKRNQIFARDRELTALGNTLQSILSLIRALGGGYQTCNCEG